MASDSVFARIEALLRQHGVEYEVMRHAPVFTSQQAAEVRGTPLSSGAKALVCKGEGRFVMFVIPADRKLAGATIRQELKWRKLRFASREEVVELTGLEPGSIPPFGSLFGLATYCDRRLGDNASVNFNAGDHSISISMSYADYVRVEKPQLGEFAE